jgi:hypothetical protein
LQGADPASATVKPIEPARAVGRDLAVVAVLFALVETAAAFVTGSHPAADALWITVLSAGFVLAAGGAGVTLVASVAPVRLPRAALQGVILLPPLLLVAARWPWAGVLLPFAAWPLWRRPSGLAPWSLAALASGSLAAGAAAVTAFRVPWALVGRQGAALTALLCCVAGIAGAVAIRRVAPRAAGATQIASGATLAIVLLASALGNVAPRIPLGTPGQPGASAPNVLLVVMDTVRRDRTSLHGYARETTPTLERIARRAVVFDRAVASGHYSLASHASMLTGLRPSQHGAHLGHAGTGHLGLLPDVPSLPLSLAARGYRTAGFSANHPLFAAWTGLPRVMPGVAAGPLRACGYAPSAVALWHRLGGDGSFPCHRTWPASTVTDAALEFAAAAGPAPWFLFLNYFDAHAPYDSPAAFRRRLPWPPRGAGATEDYDAALAHVDAELGRLLAGLERLGVLTDTLLVVTSDHGELLGEEGLGGHPPLPREELLAVPLLVALPGQERRVDASVRVAHHHIPRLVETGLAGGDPERLAAAVGDTEPGPFSELWTQAPRDAGWRITRVAYAGSLKLVERVDGTADLYDLAAAGDRQPLPAEVARPSIEEMRARLPALVSPPPRPGATAEPAQIEALRALGYLGR